MSDSSHSVKVSKAQVKVVDENLHQNEIVSKDNPIATNLSSEHDVNSFNHEKDSVVSEIAPSSHELQESTCVEIRPISCSESELSATKSDLNGHLTQVHNNQLINNETFEKISVDRSSSENNSDSLSNQVATDGELTSEKTNSTSGSLAVNPGVVKFPEIEDMSKNCSNEKDVVFSSKSISDNDDSVESKNNNVGENFHKNQDVSETNINSNTPDFENRNGSMGLKPNCPTNSQIDQKPEDPNLSVEQESESSSNLPFSKVSTISNNDDKNIKVTFSTHSIDESHNLGQKEEPPNSDIDTNSLNENCLNTNNVEESANQQNSDSEDKIDLCAIESEKAILTESSTLTSGIKSDSLTENIQISNINDIECVSSSDCDQKDLNQITISSSPSIETVGEAFSQGEVNSLPKSETADNLKIKNKIQVKEDECTEEDFEDIIYLDNSLLDQDRKDQVKSFRKLGIKHCQVNLGNSRISSQSKSKDVEKPNFNKLKRKLEDMLHSAQRQEDNAMKQLKKMRLEKSNMLQDIVKEIQKIKKKFLV